MLEQLEGWLLEPDQQRQEQEVDEQEVDEQESNRA